ncbi:helix-turn-helix transcriptional regulator [Gluconacetobacter takamatsuzukensis]|uniref:Helix-turn-helix transcriptional regulator n=2 Tax=Gluconacetobacter takamatsuzukensis TaxID=1286190 RepID=A0A7W4KEQ0_9PROT|nr:helix-turn-helix transcriptional regulator [Gluconacetobacter takamatsuzukensis]
MSAIIPEQCLGARAMLRLKRDDLAKAAQVAVATLADFETGRRAPHPRTIEAIRTALESAGVEFIAENGGGAGVRLRKEITA